MMNGQALIAAFIVAAAGLLWFHLVMAGLKKRSRPARYGIYAAVWLAYFIVTLLVIGRQGS